MKDKYEYTFDENTIVIHLRLGDILVEESKNEWCRIHRPRVKNRSNTYCNIPAIINKLKQFDNKFNKILIVTGIFYGKLGNSKNKTPSEVIEEIKILSYKKLDYLIDHINDLFPNKYNITVQSSSPDRDFFTLCLAKNLIQSGVSAYGGTATKINNILNK